MLRRLRVAVVILLGLEILAGGVLLFAGFLIVEGVTGRPTWTPESYCADRERSG